MKRGMKRIRNFIWAQAILVISLVVLVYIWPEQHQIFGVCAFVLLIPVAYMGISGMIREKKYMNSNEKI